MFKIIRKLRKSKRAATAIEYALIAALVSIAAVAAFQALGDAVTDIFYGLTSSVDAAVPSAL
ncbi:MAG: Flp family type IVb pilin [Proteobacteria bacterium]|nr:Flp family type IVb pilin [Pseudomonadota bacterium]